MGFTKTARIIAWCVTILGILRVAMGVLVINSEPSTVAAARFLGSKTTGEAIDQGLYWFACGILIGVLTEISYSVANAKE